MANDIVSFIFSVTHLASFPIFCGYLLLVFLCRLYCRFTKPLELRPILVVYNFVCSLLSAYTLFGFFYGMYEVGEVYSRTPTETLKLVFYIYWVTKNIELLDTVFMVLRHKTRQISFLHVYHHSSMVILSDYGRMYSPWPAIATVLALNSMVHVVLYLYYGLAAVGSPPPWKRRVTELQILQFFIDMVYGSVGYMFHGFCVYGQFYGLLMTYLFCNFYYHAYLKSRPVKPKVN